MALTSSDPSASIAFSNGIPYVQLMRYNLTAAPLSLTFTCTVLQSVNFGVNYTGNALLGFRSVDTIIPYTNIISTFPILDPAGSPTGRFYTNQSSIDTFSVLTPSFTISTSSSVVASNPLMVSPGTNITLIYTITIPYGSDNILLSISTTSNTIQFNNLVITSFGSMTSSVGIIPSYTGSVNATYAPPIATINIPSFVSSGVLNGNVQLNVNVTFLVLNNNMVSNGANIPVTSLLQWNYGSTTGSTVFPVVYPTLLLTLNSSQVFVSEGDRLIISGTIYYPSTGVAAYDVLLQDISNDPQINIVTSTLSNNGSFIQVSILLYACNLK